MMFARRADPALPVGGANMSEPQDAASESMRQTAMPGHGWPAPEGDDVRAQRSRSGFAGRRSHLSGGPWMARSESSSQEAGRMFWLMRKRLPGSYVDLTAASRS